METIYIEGDFRAFVDERYKDGSIELVGVEGKNRWVVTREDGTKYIVRPNEKNDTKSS